MMKHLLVRRFESALDGIERLTHTEIEAAVRSLAEALLDQGRLDLGKDCNLGGAALEIRVRRLFAGMGFQIREARARNLEDHVVHPSEGFKTQYPLALEVKSSRKPCLERDDLRQLDDWVFELSGEEHIRKFRRIKGKNVVYITAGLPAAPSHPNPHKGVMIFNGPLGQEFDQRVSPCVNANELEFVEKRYFCVIPFQTLIQMSDQISQRSVAKEDAWEMIHTCSGILELE